MEHLWAPWRMEYIEPQTPQRQGCIFCTLPAEQQDAKNYILYRGEHCFIMLNRYPYNNGHLMIAPFAHVGALDLVEPATLAEMMVQAQLALRAINQAMNPDGYNIGINQGKGAGAGFAGHLHLHVVPRWDGDTNFMPVLADVKVMPQHLDSVYQQLKKAIEANIHDPKQRFRTDSRLDATGSSTRVRNKEAR